MSDVTAIGAEIRAARRAAGLSQVELAELVGLSDRTVRAIEQGTGSPGLSAVIAAAAALGLRLEVTR